MPLAFPAALGDQRGMSERVRIEREGGVVEVRLNRPDKLNALDLEMFEALGAAGRALLDDRSLRAVVLAGEGRAFSTGLDVSAMMALGSAGTELFLREHGSDANRAQRICTIWSELPVPVIAAVHGHAYGGGLQVALGADLRLVTPDAKLSVMEVKWGLVPDMGGTQALRHLVRLDVAKELVFTGRIVSGTEAVALGLATRVSADPLAEARALAREIAGKSPDAIRAAKRLLNASVELSRAAGLQLEAEEQRRLIGGANNLEAVQANFEKRPPVFRDP